MGVWKTGIAFASVNYFGHKLVLFIKQELSVRQRAYKLLGHGLARIGLTKILSPKRGTIQSKSIPELWDLTYKVI